jgi:hypothetical protein
MSLPDVMINVRLVVVVGMVWKVLDRASAAGLGLADLDALDDRELELRALGKRVEPKRQHALPDFEALRQSSKYGDERVEAACARALSARACSHRHVESILEHSLDRQPLLPMSRNEDTSPIVEHENVRGAKHYH